MLRRALTLLALASVLPSSALAAPLPMAVVVVEAPGVPFGTAERVDTALARLADEGRLDLQPAELAVKKLKACGRAADRVGCVRERLRKRPPLALPLHLAVIASAAPNAQVRLTCVGPRWRTPLHPHAETYVDLAAALSDGPSGEPWRERLADCLDRAAADRRL